MSVKDIADQKISIPLGDGRTLVAYPYGDTKNYKEIWIDIVEPDGSKVAVLTAGFESNDLERCIVRVWGGYGDDEYTYSHDIMRNGGKHEDEDES